MRNPWSTVQPLGVVSAAERAGRRARRLILGVAALLAAFAPSAHAQEQIITHGQLAVTGYSGSVAVAPPEGADPFDYLRIRLDGPSARVVEVRALGPQGQLTNATKPFTVTAGEVGQVFGVTLDNAPRPNIYLAATIAYGPVIAVVDESGQQKRVRKGEPGAQWMEGQFGPPALGGGPGSIWKIDGATGAVSLFANVASASLGTAALGGLAFDPRTNQIFAVDRATGIIHRFRLDGVEAGTYDHGTEGRGPAGLPPIPQTPAVPTNIGSPAFDTENPATWGLAVPARRVYALAVEGDRLYYTVNQGPQVWSVGISPSGAVAAGPRVEIEVPSLQDGVEIASIAFDGQGRMYLAERGATTGDYFRYNLANGGASRVLRYVRKLPGDPTPGRWRLSPEVYSIGLPPIHANAAGGVALGYGYNQDNVIDFNRCAATVWSTGERLLDPGDPTLPADSYPNIDGLQGNAANLVQPQNTPPTQSWFVDYDDLNGDANFRGHVGAVATLPCPGQPQVLPPPPPPPPVSCPPGTYFQAGQCLIIPKCPPGTYYANGQCYYDDCPPGYYFANGQCLPPPVVCPPGTFYYQGQCFPIACPPGLIKLPSGQCACPPGNVFFNGQCVPPQNCPPGMIELFGGICWCPLGTIFDDGLCKPNVCPPGQVWQNGFCQPCGPNQEIWNGQCVPKCPPGKFRAPDGTCKDFPLCLPPNEIWNGQCVPKCPPGKFRAPDGTCKDFVLCLPPNEVWNGQCVPKCPPGKFRAPDGTCKAFVLCLPPNEIWNGQCVPKCPPGQVHQPPNGACGPGDLAGDCPPGEEKWQGACVPKCPPFQFRKDDGTCGPLTLCLPPKEIWNGKCVPKCPPGQVHLPPNGVCVALPVLPEPPVGPQPPIGPLPPVGPQPPIGPIGPQPPIGPLPPVGPQPPQPPIGPIGPQPPIGPLPPIGPQPPIGPIGPQPPVQPEPPIGPQPPVGPVGPGIKLPDVIRPLVPPSPPSDEAPVEPPAGPPTQPPTGPGLQLPGLQVPAIRLPGTEPSPPSETSPPPSTPQGVQPQINLPALQKLQPQIRTAPAPEAEPPAEEVAPEPGATPQAPTPTTPGTIPLLRPQLLAPTR